VGRELSLLVLATTLACEQAPPDTDGDTDRSPRIELGEIDEAGAFTRYADGTSERIIMGLQGGFHIFVDARLVDDDDQADEYVLELVLTYDDGSPITDIEHRRAPDLTDDAGNPTFPEMIIFIDDPNDVAGRDVVLEANVTAANSVVEGDTARLVLRTSVGD